MHQRFPPTSIKKPLSVSLLLEESSVLADKITPNNVETGRDGAEMDHRSQKKGGIRIINYPKSFPDIYNPGMRTPTPRKKGKGVFRTRVSQPLPA